MGFFAEMVAHLRLTWRLLWDARVRWWQRSVFVVPLIYLLIPVRYDALADIAPVIGLLDDWLLWGLATYLFVAICPRPPVRAYRAALALSDLRAAVREEARTDLATRESLSEVEQLEMYRHPQEVLALALSLAIVLGVLTAGGMVLGVLAFLLLSASYLGWHMVQKQMLKGALRVDAEQHPKVLACVGHCLEQLSRVPIDVTVMTSSERKACALGTDHPYTIVLGSWLVQELETDELAAVIGHELGHVLFEHTFLSALMGGVLDHVGITNFLWALILARWRRFADQTADRTALLACGQLSPVVRMIVRTTARTASQVLDVSDVLRQVYDWEPGTPRMNQGPFVQAYPSVARRIRALVDFDAQLLTWNVEMWLTQDR